VLGACNYTASETVKTGQGDEIAGPVGSLIQRGSAYDPQPEPTITGSANVTQVVKPQGTVRLEWLTGQGGNFTGNAGTGVGLAGGQMTPSSVVDAVVIKDNEGAGVSNFNGTFVRSELTNNATDPNALGFIGSGLKAVNEVVVKQSYIHDTQATASGVTRNATTPHLEPSSWKIPSWSIADAPVFAGRKSVGRRGRGADPAQRDTRQLSRCKAGGSLCVMPKTRLYRTTDLEP
jgi:hypothetical protein